MGEVDSADQMLRYYTCIRKTVKWYRRVLFHEREGANRPGRVALDFRYELAEGLIGNSRTQPKTPNAPRNEKLRLQNVGAHVPEMLSTRGNCAICSKKKEYLIKMTSKISQRIGQPRFHTCHAQAYFAGCVMYSCASRRITTVGELIILK